MRPALLLSFLLLFKINTAIGQYVELEVGSKFHLSDFRHQFSSQPIIDFKLGFNESENKIGSKVLYFFGDSKDSELKFSNIGIGIFYERELYDIFDFYFSADFSFTHNFTKIVYAERDRSFSSNGFGVSPGVNIIRKHKKGIFKIHIDYFHTFLGSTSKGNFGNIGGLCVSFGFSLNL